MSEEVGISFYSKFLLHC